MRKPIIGGNWKMNRGTPDEVKEMLKKFLPQIKGIDLVDIVICAPFTALQTLIENIKKTNIKVGAQNMYFEEKGAFTGEISPNFLRDLGVEYVILGHSERRDIFKESDEFINKKLKKALYMHLKPIVCIGEHLDERESGKTKEVIEVFKKIGLYDDIIRAKDGKHIRAGKGKIRGRKYRVPKSLLVVTKKENIKISTRNLPGIDVIKPSKININNLAPGGVAGRLTVFTKSSLTLLGGGN